MSTHTHLSASYSRTPIVVWVEDDLTKQYLSEIWNDKDVGFLIAGSKNAVTAVVKDADVGHVFGIVDRDFEPSNFDKWENTTADFRVFKLPVFEIENYLLGDIALIESCSGNYAHRNSTEIAQRLQRFANRLVYWISCRDVLAGHRSDIIGDYPEHPKLTEINSLDDAERYITETPWYKNLKPRSDCVVSNVIDVLNNASEKRKQQLPSISDDWLREYPGKELFREVRGYVFQTGSGRQHDSKSDKDIALARSIAREQVNVGNVPKDLHILLRVLKTRVNLES